MHSAYKRIVPGSKNAVLLIHGIAGTPAHFQPLLPLIPDDWSVHNLLLDGHGKRIEDFSATSMKKWKQQAAGALRQLLEQHDRVVIVAHSMGTLFAIDGAVTYPEKVSDLLLLAVPLRPRVSLAAMVGGMHIAMGRPEKHKTAMAMKAASSIDHDRRALQYIGWLPRMAELLVECRRVRRMLPCLPVKAYAYQSRVDELVSIGALKDLRKDTNICCHVLEDSGHFSYAEGDWAIIQDRLRRILTAEK